jgi:hypothetical protein
VFEVAKELSTLTCEKLKPGPRRREIVDGRLAGLRLIIQPSGRKSWCLRYKAGGKSRKLTIGSYPAIGLATARERAGKAIADGHDPGAEKKAAKAAPTASAPVHDLIETAVAQFVTTHAKRRLKASTAREVERILNKEYCDAMARPAAIGNQTARRDRWLDGIVDRPAPIAANRALGWFKGLCNFAVERGVLDVSPIAGIKPPAAETARDRVLSDGELRAVWRAADALGQP